MLATLLLAGIVAAPLGTAALFMPARRRTAMRRRSRSAGTWPAFRRLVLAVAGTSILAGAVAATLYVLAVSERYLVVAVAGFVIASLAWLPATRRWRARAHLCWASTVFLFAAYLAFALDWTFASHLGPAGTAGGVVLWFLECSRSCCPARTCGRSAMRWAPSTGAAG